MKVFVDTAAWIALLDATDSLHQPAKQVRNRLRQQQATLVTTDFVLIELANALCASNLRAKVIAFVNNLRQLGVAEIVPASESLLAQGWALYSQRPDKFWSLTDCTSFVVMEREQIAQAFTSDRHFQQAGFTKLL